jgi:hypothetical protein
MTPLRFMTLPRTSRFILATSCSAMGWPLFAMAAVAFDVLEPNVVATSLSPSTQCTRTLPSALVSAVTMRRRSSG